jgi:hypothetical protein
MAPKLRFQAAARVGRERRRATGVPEEWPSLPAKAGQNPAYRPSGVQKPENRTQKPGEERQECGWCYVPFWLLDFWFLDF